MSLENSWIDLSIFFNVRLKKNWKSCLKIFKNREKLKVILYELNSRP